jgi:hypothetical protein
MNPPTAVTEGLIVISPVPGPFGIDVASVTLTRVAAGVVGDVGPVEPVGGSAGAAYTHTISVARLPRRLVCFR